MVTPVIFLKHSLHVVSTFFNFEDNTLFFYKYLNFLFEYVQDLLEHISGSQETVSPDIQIRALKIKVSVERIPHTSFLQPTSRFLDIELNKAKSSTWLKANCSYTVCFDFTFHLTFL